MAIRKALFHAKLAAAGFSTPGFNLKSPRKAQRGRQARGLDSGSRLRPGCLALRFIDQGAGTELMTVLPLSYLGVDGCLRSAQPSVFSGAITHRCAIYLTPPIHR